MEHTNTDTIDYSTVHRYCTGTGACTISTSVTCTVLLVLHVHVLRYCTSDCTGRRVHSMQHDHVHVRCRDPYSESRPRGRGGGGRGARAACRRSRHRPTDGRPAGQVGRRATTDGQGEPSDGRRCEGRCHVLPRTHQSNGDPSVARSVSARTVRRPQCPS